MITDIHAHYHPDRYVEALRKARPGAQGAMAPHPDTGSEQHIQERLRIMEDADVGLQVLSPAAARAPYGNNEADAVEAARVINDLSAELVARFPDKFKEIRVIWTSPLIPLDPLVMRKDLTEATKAKIRNFFYTYGQGGQREKDALMKLSKLSMFKESSNRQLIPIRQLELFREKTKIEADNAIPAADKQARLGDINRRLAELNQQLAQK